MLDAIANITDGSGRVLLNSQCDLAIALLGGIECTLTPEQKVKILSISAEHIARMYDKKVKEGVR